MRVLYLGRIGTWFLWSEENWRTQRKTLGARRKPKTAKLQNTQPSHFHLIELE